MFVWEGYGGVERHFRSNLLGGGVFLKWLHEVNKENQISYMIGIKTMCLLTPPTIKSGNLDNNHWMYVLCLLNVIDV